MAYSCNCEFFYFFEITEELAQVMVQGCLSKCQRIRIMDCCQLFEMDHGICSVTNARDHLFRGVVTTP